MILIALGANLPSNVGPPAATLRAALENLQPNVIVRAYSPFYRSAAWPDPRDPEFVNAVAKVDTDLSPFELLTVLKQTEHVFGRESARRNAPRPLDLDILDYNGRIENGLPTLPHPRLRERGFVLIPLRDVVPDWTHPVCGLGVDALIDSLPDHARAVTRLDDSRD